MLSGNTCRICNILSLQPLYCLCNHLDLLLLRLLLSLKILRQLVQLILVILIALLKRLLHLLHHLCHDLLCRLLCPLHCLTRHLNSLPQCIDLVPLFSLLSHNRL